MTYLAKRSGVVDFETFKSILAKWLKESKAKTIGDLKGRRSNPETLLHFHADGYYFRLHADTKREAIVRLLTQLRLGEPITVTTPRNSKVLGTTVTKKRIPGLYIYRD